VGSKLDSCCATSWRGWTVKHSFNWSSLEVSKPLICKEDSIAASTEYKIKQKLEQ